MTRLSPSIAGPPDIEPEESQRIQASLLQLSLILWLAASLWAAESLWRARPLRQLTIHGAVTGPKVPLEQLLVDADLRLDADPQPVKVRLKVVVGGQQYVAFPPEGESDVWARKLDSPASYSVRWSNDGRYALTLELPLQSTPTACRLTFRRSNGTEFSSLPFKLRAIDREELCLSGFAPPVTIKDLPSQTARPIPSANPAVEEDPLDWRNQEPDISFAEEEDIGSQAELALLSINRMPIRELRALCLSMDSLQTKLSQSKHERDHRTQTIARMLNGVFHRKMEFVSNLDSGPGSFTQTPADMANQSVEEATLSEN